MRRSDSRGSATTACVHCSTPASPTGACWRPSHPVEIRSAAYAGIVIGGCNFVAHPSPTRFTSCPGANLTYTVPTGLNLRFADLSGASMATCTFQPPPGNGFVCSNGVLRDEKLNDADLTNAITSACTTFDFVGGVGNVTVCAG
ncbi:MAG: pentapeptide repeat-containing protein, partial [Acidimicrobiales bacterium]